MDQQSFQPIRLADYRPPEFLAERLSLCFSLAADHTLVRATSVLHRNRDARRKAGPLLLSGEHLELLEVRLNGERVAPDAYRITPESLEIDTVPDDFQLEVVTRLYPDRNTALSGLYRSSGMYCTQCEAQGFRRITYYLDRPDVLTRFFTRIEAEAESFPVLLANGNLVAAGRLPQGRHFVEWDDPFPKPSYLFALVAGNLSRIEDSFVTRSGRQIVLQIYVEEHNRHKCDHAMDSLKKAMKWDEETYGLEYDLNQYMIVAVDHFNMGAMENKGLNIFNAKYVLASPETATDQDYLGIQAVIAHEYFHNWTGNRVTCRDWFQLSLKEGLTVFRDQQFSADMDSAAVQRINEVRTLRQVQFREDSSPLAHPVRPEEYVEINNFYTVTVYNKGAELIRMLYTLLGGDAYYRGFALYIQRHDGQAVTCEDFVQAMADASGRDLSQFMRWYTQAGTPQLTIQESWQQEQGLYGLTVSQQTPPTPGQPRKVPVPVPLLIGLLDDQGNDLTATLCGDHERRGDDVLLEVTEAEQHFRFAGLKSRPHLSVLRSFSAPVKLNSFRTQDELAFLSVHDHDLFNRWDAAFTLSEQVLLDLVNGDSGDRDEQRISRSYLQAMQSLARSSITDLSLLAEALRLPTENYVLQKLEQVDPDRLYQAYHRVKRQLAAFLETDLVDVYRKYRSTGAYRFSREDVGQRSLCGVCLDYLTSLAAHRTDLAELCRRHYQEAGNMTDRMIALTAAVQLEGDLRDELLADFEQAWHREPLVMDKWFAVQASSSAADTVERVEKLLHHPDFSLNNPNRVRALIGSFGQNHFHFHHHSGSGYRLVTRVILQLDALNPQVAARMAGPFVSWRRYDGKRQELLCASLRCMVEKPGVSRDLYEVANKSLSAQGEAAG